MLHVSNLVRNVTRLETIEFGEKLMELPCLSQVPTILSSDDIRKEDDVFAKMLSKYKEQVENRSNDFVNEEIDKISEWVDEMMTPLEDEIRELEHQQKALRSSMRKERNARTRIQLMVQMRQLKETLSLKRDQMRAEETKYNDMVDEKQEELLNSLENQVTYEPFFRFKWHIV